MLWVLLPDLAALLESSEAPAQGQLPVLLWAWLLAELCESEAYEIRCEMPLARCRARRSAPGHGGGKKWLCVGVCISCLVHSWGLGLCMCAPLTPLAAWLRVVRA